MWGVLLKKDLTRACRKPWPYLFNLALPICITALIGLVFGPPSQGESMAKIKIAVVDHDQSIIGQLFKGALSQEESTQYIDPFFLSETNALNLLLENEVSAVLILPESFTDRFLSGEPPAPLQLIKNPAQSYYPAIAEEILRIVTEALNAITRNFSDELSLAIEAMQIKERTLPDFQLLSELVRRIGNKLEAGQYYLFPPLITYESETWKEEEQEEDSSSGMNPFAYLLPGLASMFLLFLADGSVRDLYREVGGHTLDRFRTMRYELLIFILSKMVFGMVILMISSAVLFIGGGILFGIGWREPWSLMLLTVAFCFFATALMAFLAACAQTERRADMLNVVIIFLIAFLGGSMVPVREFPGFLRDYVSPFMPNHWFISGMHQLQFGWEVNSWGWLYATLKLVVLAVLFVWLASTLFHSLLAKGMRR